VEAILQSLHEQQLLFLLEQMADAAMSRHKAAAVFKPPQEKVVASRRENDRTIPWQHLVSHSCRKQTEVYQ